LAGASPQTPLGELTALPRPSSWFRGWAPGKREGGREGEKEERREGSPGMPEVRVGKPIVVVYLSVLLHSLFLFSVGSR